MSPHLEDDVDDDGTTREAKEEIGLVPSLVNVVAILEPFFSKVLLSSDIFLIQHIHEICQSLHHQFGIIV
ncbi:hypothetical protein Hdeb2414_s0022g00613881 [Helianthus debilis subsp. tardiflorus]